jgi:hypothetical protein
MEVPLQRRLFRQHSSQPIQRVPEDELAGVSKKSGADGLRIRLFDDRVFYPSKGGQVMF